MGDTSSWRGERVLRASREEISSGHSRCQSRRSPTHMRYLIKILIAIVVLVVAWMCFDARYLHTQNIRGKGKSLTKSQQFVLETNLEFTITSLSGPSLGERNVYRADSLSRSANWILSRFSFHGYSNSAVTLMDFAAPARFGFASATYSRYVTN